MFGQLLNAPGNQYLFVYLQTASGFKMRVWYICAGHSLFDLYLAWLQDWHIELSTKLADVPPDRILMLKAAYDESFQLAADEDRDKAPVRFVPRNLFYA